MKKLIMSSLLIAFCVCLSSCVVVSQNDEPDVSTVAVKSSSLEDDAVAKPMDQAGIVSATDASTAAVAASGLDLDVMVVETGATFPPT